MNFFKTYNLFIYALLCVISQQLCAAAGAGVTSSSSESKDTKIEDFGLLKRREAEAREQKRIVLENARQKKLAQLEEAESAQSRNLSRKLQEKQKEADTKYKNQYFANLKGAKPVLTADLPVEYDTESGILLARKNAKLTDKQFQLSADVIGFSSADSVAAASGDVRFSQEKLRFLSDNLSMGIKNSSFKSGHSRFGSNPIFIESNSLDYTNKSFKAKDSTVYFGEPDTFALNMKVKDIAYDAKVITSYVSASATTLGNLVANGAITAQRPVYTTAWLDVTTEAGLADYTQFATAMAAWEAENGPLPAMELNSVPPVFGREGFGPADEG